MHGQNHIKIGVSLLTEARQYPPEPCSIVLCMSVGVQMKAWWISAETCRPCR